MLISYRHRFLFVHVYKVAGSSIKRALEAAPGVEVREKPRRSPVRYVSEQVRGRLLGQDTRYTHRPARELRELVGPRTYDRLFKFAFVRNPWDWEVSLFAYMQQRAGHRQHGLARALGGFEEYLEWRISEDMHLQKQILSNERGELLVDYVGRIETIERDFEEICGRLGIEAELPHVNRSEHRDYRSYYDERTRALVADAFREDIELFGYRFDGLAEDGWRYAEDAGEAGTTGPDATDADGADDRGTKDGERAVEKLTIREGAR